MFGYVYLYGLLCINIAVVLHVVYAFFVYCYLCLLYARTYETNAATLIATKGKTNEPYETNTSANANTIATNAKTNETHAATKANTISFQSMLIKTHETYAATLHTLMECLGNPALPQKHTNGMVVCCFVSKHLTIRTPLPPSKKVCCGAFKQTQSK